MNPNQAIRRSQDLLRAAGAVPVRRNSGHEIWRFPSGAILPVQLHPRGGTWRSQRGFQNLMADIRRLARAERLRAEETP